jgi:hypothetical protein
VINYISSYVKLVDLIPNHKIGQGGIKKTTGHPAFVSFDLDLAFAVSLFIES